MNEMRFSSAEADKEKEVEAIKEPLEEPREEKEEKEEPKTDTVPKEKRTGSRSPLNFLKRVVSRLHFTKKRILVVGGCILILAALIGLTVFGMSYLKPKPQVQVQAQKPTTPADEVRMLVGEVGKIILLPQDELPAMATIVDMEKLKGQPFFANAKLGDKLLIYQKAGKAILYDPVAKKIIEVSPINMNQKK